MSEAIRIVCDMTDAPDTPGARLTAYAHLFSLGLERCERTETGMRWRFRHSPEAEVLTRELAARENACCGFMTTTVTVVGNELRWDATTVDDPMAHAVLDLMRELPERVGSAAGARREHFVEGIGVPLLHQGAVVSRDAAVVTVRVSPATPTE